jgi:Cu/Zn superoxide dismutase
MALLRTFVSVSLGFGLLAGMASTAIAADSASAALSPQSNSGESGTATLTKDGDKTKVVLSVTGSPADAQPVHIHKGTCDKLDPKPAFPLSPVTGGKSETVVNASIDELAKGYAINGHKSAQDLKTYVFCGNIAGK